VEGADAGPVEISLRRSVGRALVAGLSLAALVAVLSLLSGNLDETHLRTIATSVGFSLFSALGGAGLALRERPGAPRGLGEATAAAAAAGFLLLLVACWVARDVAWAWRAFGIAAVLALWGAHASLVVRAACPGDEPAIRALGAISIATAGFDALAAVLAISGAVDDAPPATVRVLAISGVVLVLSSVLPPILRRMAPRPQSPLTPPLPAARLADELLAMADRLDGVPFAGPEVQREAARLRALARSSS
jgi:hypothetical protein